MKRAVLFPVFCLVALSYCTTKTDKPVSGDLPVPDSTVVDVAKEVEVAPKEIIIEKELLYDQHTLADSYPYKDTTREFQWDKIRERLTWLESTQREPTTWSILQNYRNKNGEAPLVKNYHRDSYRRVADSLGVERFQGVPLYLPADTSVPELYGRDGSLVKHLEDYTNFIKVASVHTGKEWMVPRKYIETIADTVVFRKAIFVDTKNQNIATMEHVGDKWLVRSMNPATTGLHRPPYAQETPPGIFVIQEKKPRMIYLVDGTTETGGFAPYASRFTNGGYIHGVPVNAPRKNLIEFSPSLGTTPRSHMCVRNATSHAKFIYDWAPIEETLVFVFD
ncbi:L,D-transpeptidase [uncultured Parabacteroides sp.]|uniref:L,D-transpeptidase n=1 Tax=uncultured Parabacteroides sp. TaxID=512312 RepID=UPI0025D708AE|nr:L,D-transpeptidase [uncultured Parabacteroides sp.]